ncbi:hypothetical protein HK100_012349 [Physocladia obscura]|uniref:Uncharacterized protein n=1 Tax=Physocladia obscura TaxID=109957 RepID=A0AAD5XHP2_9FUNG|nr:hypothetical protein HK100_012349 [Physocladia obscura]
MTSSAPSSSDVVPTTLVVRLLLPLLEAYEAENSTSGPGSPPNFADLMSLFPSDPDINNPRLPSSSTDIKNSASIGNKLEKLRDLVSLTLRHSVRTGSAGFLDKLYAGSDGVGAFGELLCAVLNTNVHVFSVSPVLSLMERACIERLAQACGFKPHASSGVFQPGGSASNLLAMTSARNLLFPQIKRVGLIKAGVSLAVFTSVESHYSIDKSCVVLGLGLHPETLVKIPTAAPDSKTILTDNHHPMNPTALATAIRTAHANSHKPFFVVLTAGTTVLSTFDNPAACVSAVRACERDLGIRIWIHVDASYGGPVVFVPELREQLMPGLESVDSVTISPHKILGIPSQCSALIVNCSSERGWKKDSLWVANGLKADYLFHDTTTLTTGDFNEPDIPLDIGDATIGCGRRADALKLYLAWHVHGTDGFGARVSKAVNNVDTLARLVLERRKFFHLVIPYSSNDYHYAGGRLSVSFWCLAPVLVQQYGDLATFVANESVETVYRVLRETTVKVHMEVAKRGKLMVDYMGIKWTGLPEFTRVAISSPAVNEEFLRMLVDEFEDVVRGVDVEI